MGESIFHRIRARLPFELQGALWHFVLHNNTTLYAACSRTGRRCDNFGRANLTITALDNPETHTVGN